MRVHPENEDAHRAAQAWANQRTVEQAAEEGRLLCWTEYGHPYVGQKDENPPPELEPLYESDTGPDGQMIRITRDEEVIWERTPDELKTMYPGWQREPEEREPEHPARSQLEPASS